VAAIVAETSRGKIEAIDGLDVIEEEAKRSEAATRHWQTFVDCALA
jgi:hypothetical protein